MQINYTVSGCLRGEAGSQIQLTGYFLAPNPVNRLILAPNPNNWLILAPNPVKRLLKKGKFFTVAQKKSGGGFLRKKYKKMHDFNKKSVLGADDTRENVNYMRKGASINHMTLFLAIFDKFDKISPKNHIWIFVWIR